MKPTEIHLRKEVLQMNPGTNPSPGFATAACFRNVIGLWLSVMLTLSSSVHAAATDLTAVGVIATIDRSRAYNLEPIGLRAWIYAGEGRGQQGTTPPRSWNTAATSPGGPQ